MVVTPPDEVAHKILRWFEANARDLPWRTPPGRALPLDDPDWPFRVWLSEIMLQQTTVAAVRPYFEAFTTRWPGVTALAAADDADVMAAWAGLGYYARARNLLACARQVVAQGGHFPESEAELRTLPGIGDYTAAAIAAFAFGRRAVVVDGNIERVTARLFAIDTPLPAAKPEIRRLVDELTPEERAGDFAQGLMDLAQAICTPRAPKCLICPLAEACKGRPSVERYPVKPAKAAKPQRSGTAWWIEHADHVWLVRRPSDGLLGGMRALPSSDWSEAGALSGQLPVAHSLGSITHVFTHFRLSLVVAQMGSERGCALHPDGEWWPLDRLDEAGLPTVFAKAAARALAREE